MALPKLNRSLLSIVMPSNKKPVQFQPMNRQCEKLLLMAKESKEPGKWVTAVRQVVANCVVDGTDVDAMASFDLEYAFVKLRAASINNRETLSYRDQQDDRVYDVEVDLDDVQVVFPTQATTPPIIEVADDVKMSMRWPRASTWADPAITDADDPEDALDALVAHCIDKIWVGENSYDASASSREEVNEFVQSLDVQTWNKIREWTATVPHLSYWVSWKNSLGEERRVELRTLTDFFSFQ